MTVGIVIKAKDGIVVACYSLSTFARGVPVLRYANKIYVIEHPDLENRVVVIGAGMSTFVDKFISRVKTQAITLAKADIAKHGDKRKLDIVDFSERVAETVVCLLFKEYAVDRQQFFGMNIGDYSLSLIIAGATHAGELKSYFVYGNGLSEAVEDYGTIGSGAAYAELFMRNLMPEPSRVSAEHAAGLSVYVIKGVEIMDPYVGGKTNVNILKMVNKTLEIAPLKPVLTPMNAKEKMDRVLSRVGENMRNLIMKKR